MACQSVANHFAWFADLHNNKIFEGKYINSSQVFSLHGFAFL